jgi:hypothetical protein
MQHLFLAGLSRRAVLQGSLGTIAMCTASPSLLAGTALSAITPRLWLEDMDFMKREMLRRYPWKQRALSPDRFVALLEEASNFAETGDPIKIVMAMAKAVAQLEDGHTSVEYFAPPLGDIMRPVPLALYFYGNDLRINAATQSMSELAGAKIVAINGYPVGRLTSEISAYIAADNQQEILHELPRLLAVPAVLQALGYAAAPGRLMLDVELLDESAASVPIGLSDVVPPENMTFARPTGDKTPPYLKNAQKSYWLEMVEGESTAYIQLNSLSDDRKGPSIAEFAKMADAQMKPHTRFLIFDLRHNTGGNFYRAAPLLALARKHAGKASGNRNIAIVGRRTFSAAIVMAMQLKVQSNADLVGETPRGRPNFTFNRESFKLPHSGLPISYSQSFKMIEPLFGNAKSIPLDREILLSFDQYRQGIDPVMDAILGRDSPAA